MSIESAETIGSKAQRCGFCKAAIAGEDVICGKCGAAVPDRKARAMQTRCSYCASIYPRGFISCPYCGERSLSPNDETKLRLCSTCGNLVALEEVCSTCKAIPEEQIWPPSPYQRDSPRRRSASQLWSGEVRADVWIGFLSMLLGFGLTIWLGMTGFFFRPQCMLYAPMLIFGWNYACRMTRKSYPHVAAGMSIAYWICTGVTILCVAMMWMLSTIRNFD